MIIFFMLISLLLHTEYIYRLKDIFWRTIV